MSGPAFTTPRRRSSPIVMLFAWTVAPLGPAPALAALSPDQESPEQAQMVAPDPRILRFTIGLGFGTRNLSAGVSASYLGYLQTKLSSDFILTSLTSGFANDDLSALRFSASQAVGARLTLAPLGIERWHGALRQRGDYPDLILGLGAWGVLELDNLTQLFRLGDPGLYLGLSTGPLLGLRFHPITVTLMFRPLGSSYYLLDGRWDQTAFQLRNAGLDVELTYTLPW